MPELFFEKSSLYFSACVTLISSSPFPPFFFFFNFLLLLEPLFLLFNPLPGGKCSPSGVLL